LRIGVTERLNIIKYIMCGEPQIQRKPAPDWQVIAQPPPKVTQPGYPVRVQVTTGTIVTYIVRGFCNQSADITGQEVILYKSTEEIISGFVVLPLFYA
jgi:hypothetical protein